MSNRACCQTATTLFWTRFSHDRFHSFTANMSVLGLLSLLFAFAALLFLVLWLFQRRDD